MSEIDDAVEDEVVLGESVSDENRRIRVYGPGGEDFVVDVPAKAKITFSYFNPALSGSPEPNNYGMRENVSKQTALRIYEHGDKGNQLACFLGVRGFRDERVRRTNLVQRVVVERRYAKDAETEEWSGQSQRELVVAPEDTPF